MYHLDNSHWNIMTLHRAIRQHQNASSLDLKLAVRLHGSRQLANDRPLLAQIIMES